MTTLLIDGDSLLWLSKAMEDGKDPGSLGMALNMVSNKMSEIIVNTKADKFKLFIHGKGNFRKQIDPEYKGHRKNIDFPIYMWETREYLINHWSAKIVNEIEVDDMVSILQNKDSIVCGIDKDLLQIPGKHYNYRNNTFTEISEKVGVLNFYTQVLVGDPADNIKGVYGIGPKKATKILEGSETEKEMYERVREAYLASGIDEEKLEKNCRLMYLLKHHGDSWRAPE